jgi:hypothetical protein
VTGGQRGVAADLPAVADTCLPLGLALGLTGLVLAPLRRLWQEAPRDSFPFSHYPMFSRARGSELEVVHLVGIGPDGSRRPLPHTLAGPGGMNQQRKQIARTVRRGKAPGLASRVARRVARRPGLDDLTAVEAVTSTVGLANWFAGDMTVREQIVHARAEVPRAARVPLASGEEGIAS